MRLLEQTHERSSSLELSSFDRTTELGVYWHHHLDRECDHLRCVKLQVADSWYALRTDALDDLFIAVNQAIAPFALVVSSFDWSRAMATRSHRTWGVVDIFDCHPRARLVVC